MRDMCAIPVGERRVCMFLLGLRNALLYLMMFSVRSVPSPCAKR